MNRSRPPLRGLEDRVEPTGERSASPRRGVLAFRVAVAIGLLTVLVTALDLDRVKSLFGNMRLGYVFATLGLILVVRAITAIRWVLLLRDGGIRVALSRITKVIFISMFLGQFLPGAVGPDIVRGVWVARRRGQGTIVTASLLSDRLIGVFAMVIVAVVGAALGDQRSAMFRLAGIPLLLLIAALPVFAVIYRLAAARGRARPPRGRLARIMAKVRMGAYAIVHVLQQPRLFATVALMSVVVVLIRCLMFLCLYLAFGAVVPFDLLMVFIPVMFAAVMIPISISGLGVREATLAYLLATVGIATEVSVSVGLVFQALQVVGSIPGAAFWLTERRGAPRVQRGPSLHALTE